MEENDPKPSEAAAEGQRQPGSSPSGGPGDADTGRRRALMLPAVLQAPGNHPHPHRITNFFIDNILRPEFGRRKDAGTCGGGGEGGAGGAEGGGAEQPLGPGREPRQSAPGAPSAGGPLPSGGESPGEGEGGSKALSLHSGAKKGGDPGGSLDGALKARGLGGGDLSLSSDSDSSQASANLGTQPMLWPAWVYCTRYSDRPSSGEPAGIPHPGCCGEARGAAGWRWRGDLSGGRHQDPPPKPPHTHKDAHIATLCAADAAPAAGGRPAGRMESPGYRLLTTAEAGRPPLSAQPQPPTPGWSLFGRTRVGGRQARKLAAQPLFRSFRLSLDPGPTPSSPADLDSPRDPETPDAASEERARLLLPRPLGLSCRRRVGGSGEGRAESRRPLPSAPFHLPIPQCGAYHPFCTQLGEGGPAILPDRRDLLPELPWGCSLVGKEQVSEEGCAASCAYFP